MNVQSIGAMRLSTVMSGLFVLLSIPVLIFILAYNYRQNAAAINATLNDVVANTKQASIGNAENLINPVAATLSLLAAVAAEDPSVFRKDESRNLLYQSLISARQIDAAFVSFEDGFHRVVTRVDDDRRRSDPKRRCERLCRGIGCRDEGRAAGHRGRAEIGLWDNHDARSEPGPPGPAWQID